MVDEGAKSGIFVTTGGFSKNAKEKAKEYVPPINSWHETR
jgi:restriction endonuclease Mrr